MRDLEAWVDQRSGRELAEALGALGHETHWIPVDEDLDLRLRQTPVDACVLALHGALGGRGEAHALLSVRKIPYFGPPGPAAAAAFDKIRARQLIAYHNLPVAPALVLGADHQRQDRALALLGWPCFVKPRRGALGQGVEWVEDPGQLNDAIARARRAVIASANAEPELFLERAFAGREIQVVVLHGRVVGSAEILEPTDSGGAEAAELICPPRMSRGRLDGIHSLARRAVAALGLDAGPCRVDILANDRQNEVILEVEPLPPLHESSTTTRVLRAAGVNLEGMMATWLQQLRRPPLHQPREAWAAVL